MKKEVVGKFKNKDVKIYIKQGFCYFGKVVEVNEEDITLKSKKYGLTCVMLNDISSLSESKEEEY